MLTKLHGVYRYFSIDVRLMVLNASLLLLVVSLNMYFQVFCIPTAWATTVIAICFVNTMLYPTLEKKGFYPFTSFISGISFFVFLYCCLFLEQLNAFGLFMLLAGVGCLVFIPHFFALQLLWRNCLSPRNNSSRIYFLSALLVCTGNLISIRHTYQDALHSIGKFKKSNYTRLEKNFMTEKILGMHFIYHTRFCEYDRWRPPKHEPLLVIGLWLSGRKDPLEIDLSKRIKLYRKFFPENTYVFSCSCAFNHGDSYHQDLLFRQ